MFWGLILEPKKRYSQIVSKAFHVSNAALDVATGDNGICQVLVTYNGSNFLLCTLQKDKTIQTPLDLCFKEGDKISFISNGNCYVHLTGYLNPDYDFEDMEEEEDEEAEEGASEDEEVPQLEAINKKKRKLEETSPGNSKKAKEESKKNKALSNSKAKVVQVEEDDDEEEDDDDDDSDSETDIKKLLEGSLSDTADDSYLPNNSKDVNVDSDDDDDEEEDEDDEEGSDDDSDAEEEEEEEKVEVKESKKKQKQNNKAAQQNGHAEKKDKVVEQPKEKKQKEPETKQVQKRVLAGNVVVEDIRVGQGAPAKSGKMVQVFYEGRLLSNNKMFDSCNKTPGFKFRLGKKEVISGWDVGILGMKIGGKRKITCPPGMAYGNKGSPPVIPPNSTLVFEVELKGVN